jgi:glycosyltransferase involved in cell wall biosynthesis
VAYDYALAIAQRIPIRGQWKVELISRVMDARTRAIARAGARAVRGNAAVVGSWGCAELAFRNMKNRGGICVLNYPLAHHDFARKLLMEEAEREPAFAETLNGQEWPRWLTERMDAEIALADRILVGSSFARDTFRAEGVPAEKLEVLPYGVDQSLFAPVCRGTREKERSFRLLFVGQIGQRKGIAYLLRAYERFRDPRTRLTLVGRIIGDGRALRPYRGLFEHIDHVPRSILASLYREADVLVFPTLLEGMPLVVLEAMASGLPVITTANGPDDLVRDGIDGFVVPIRDVEAIVDRLRHLRQEPDLRLAMGRNARERALQFTWDMYRQRAVGKIQSWLEKPTPHDRETRDASLGNTTKRQTG